MSASTAPTKPIFDKPQSDLNYWIIKLAQCCYMIRPPGSLPTPTPAFHSWRISGEVLWVGPSCLMHYLVPYIPPPLVPAGDWRRVEHCCHD